MTEPTFLSRTRQAYDTVAVDYANLLRTAMADRPLDRAMMAAFAELVRTADTGPVADVGCGPGHLTAYLHELGPTVFGIDLSPAMVAVARREYPQLRFDVGTMTGLELPDAGLGGVSALYSIIHIPPPELPRVFAEFHRVLTPGGYLLLAFQVGDEPRRITDAYGHAITLDAYRLPPDRITDQLGEAGFAPYAQLVREPTGSWEKSPQAYLLASKRR